MYGGEGCVVGLVKTLRLPLVHIQDGLGVRVQKPRTPEWVVLSVTTRGHSNALAHTSRLTAMLCPLLSSSVASPPSTTSTLSDPDTSVPAAPATVAKTCTVPCGKSAGVILSSVICILTS